MIQPITNNFLYFKNITKQPESQIIASVALQCLAELAFSLATNNLVCKFIATSIEISMVSGALAIQTLTNTALRSTAAFVKWKEQNKTEETKRHHAQIVQIANSICPCTFAWLTGINGQTLTHEAGHALAASMLYKTANPLIQIYPFAGGTTFYTGNHLSTLGTKLGKNQAYLIVAASGSALTLLVSSILLGLSFKIKEKHPQISSYLKIVALFDFFMHISYALSALWFSPLTLSHDFVCLATFGIHPIAAAVTIAAIPIFTTYLSRSCTNTNRNK